MKKLTKDAWCRPWSIYRSFFSRGVLVAGIVFLVCVAVVLGGHLFEASTLEASVLRYTPVAGCIIPNAFE